MSNKIVRLTLMNKNKPIVDFDYNTELNVVYSIYRDYKENEKYAPLGIIDLKIGISKVNLMNWFKNRVMPKTRDGIEEILKKYNNEYEFSMKPFYKDPIKQLSLVDDLSWLNLESLNDFDIEVRNILRLNNLLSEKYIEEQVCMLNDRIKNVVEYKNKLEGF